MKVKNDNLETITSPADYTGKEGYLVDSAGAIMASATAVPDAVIIDGGPNGAPSTIQPLSGGGAGHITMKLSGSPGTVNKATKLVSVNNGTVKADPGTGARVIVAEARESGTADERIKVVPISPPIVFGS